MIPLDALDQLTQRLKAAAWTLDTLSKKATKPSDSMRLAAKAEGVRLAQGYLRELRNEISVQSFPRVPSEGQHEQG